jgi:hypothetical protein
MILNLFEAGIRFQLVAGGYCCAAVPEVDANSQFVLGSHVLIDFV